MSFKTLFFTHGVKDLPPAEDSYHIGANELATNYLVRD